jgi:ribosomal protein S18 acetylase RimI-like enzyme
MPITIKVLAAGDAEILDRLAEGTLDHPVDTEATRTFLEDPRHHMVVAMDDDLVVGFVSAVHYVHPDKPAPEMWINEVGIAPSHQRRGLARALLGSLFEEAKRLGCAEAWVLTDRGNTAAIRLYRAAGGEEAPVDSVMFTFLFDDDHVD